MQYATRRNRKGRAMDGIILGVRKDTALEIKQTEWKEEGIAKEQGKW